MNVQIPKKQKQIIHKVAKEQGISEREAEIMYLSYFEGLRTEFEKYDDADDSTDCNIRIKHFGVFYNHSRIKLRDKALQWKKNKEERNGN